MMTKTPLKVRTYPDPCLRIKTRQVEVFDEDLSDMLKTMADLMYLDEGIGLAATQVGLGLSIMVIDAGDGLRKFVNPEVTEASSEATSFEEGCLSLPGLTVDVTRPARVKVRAQDEKGEFFLRTYDGLAAKAVQHEMDHLNGRLILDHLNPIKHFIASRKLKKDKLAGDRKTCEVTCGAGR